MKKLLIITIIATIFVPTAFAWTDDEITEYRNGESIIVLTSREQKCIPNNDINCVQKSIDAGADANGIFTTAMSFGNFDIADLALERGADINNQHRFGYTALILSVMEGDLVSIKYLLDNSADVNIQDDVSNWTALMHAACFWNAEDAAAEKTTGAPEESNRALVAKTLLTHKKAKHNFCLVNRYGDTVRDCALQKMRKGIAQWKKIIALIDKAMAKYKTKCG
ncbi:MAG: ankyrin repeat domain-containing protein [Elusimicrobiota bacterium]|jgi:ankyrin repeat protein|nr:ankyrin repeat domain-containing protein [Elusimicrobiota bacterium]